MVALSAGAALLAGALSSVQSRANGQLAQVFGAPADASLWSFGSGWVLLLALVLLVPQVRRGVVEVVRAVRERRLRPWTTVGGILGAAFVAVQTFAVPTIGVALFTIAIVGGQTTSALLVDRLGLGPAGRVHVTAGRVVAALLTFVGVAVAVSARSGSGASAALPVVPVLLAVLAGAGIALQQAINGRVNRVSGSPLATTAINFTWGVGTLLGWALALAVRGGLHPPRTWHAPWWAFLGGFIGIVYIAIGAVVVHHLGVLVAALITLTGQLVSAVVIDLLSPSAQGHVGPQLLLGVGLTLVAALGAGVAAQRARRVAR
ncbi:DMT family transporter [Arsenicicoccus sp. oral taxon 190]|uniref:DMT family transporter n=1 Tax=Arsenicicoccus sp. oral taxon 190 TaxID=1658671 RepID=UPI00067CB994|nr:DMT family transporter [Arsenicicoccus sp. oral taxon 190]